MANTIAYNGEMGIQLNANSGSGNAISGNSIHSNTTLGIDINSDGVTANDPDDVDIGANNLQNYPVLTQAFGGSSTVSGTLNSTASTTFRVELFANSACDPSGFGEGATFLGSANVSTDLNGDATFAASISGFSAGQFISATATDPSNNTSEFSACIEAVLNLNQPPVADAGENQIVECGTPAGTDVTLDGTGSSDPDDDDLTYAWSENGQPLATGPTPTVTLSPGTHTIDLVVNDGLVDSPPDQVQIQITDTSPPVITLLGADPILVEIGTPYTDPGATALDACDGDLTSAIIVANPVDSNTEGEYTVTYTVADAAGNPASAPRTVEVVSTPNSYVLVAAHSMHIKQHATVHTGFAGVVDYGTPPFQARRVELVIGPHAFTQTDVRVSSPRVRIKNKATIAGTLVYDELKVGRHVTIGEHVTPGTWPLFEDFGLPDFVTGTPGTVDILVRKRETVTLSPEDGPFGTIRVKHKGSLILTGGEYHIGSMHLGTKVAVVVQAPTTMLIAGKFALGQHSYFGPETAAVDPSEILVYVEGENGHHGKLKGHPKAAKVGGKAVFAGNIYAPNGTIHLRHHSRSTGSFIGKDLILGVRAKAHLRSGWNTPGVLYDPQLPVAKLLSALSEDHGLVEQIVDNYPNPFNPATTVRYRLPAFGWTRLTVYNALGQEVRVLVDQPQPTGVHSVEWDGREQNGQTASSGLYFYQLINSGKVHTGRMLLIK